MNTDRAQIEALDDARDFVLAGRATVTLQNTRTGGRYTFSVNRARPERKGDEPPPRWYVGLLTGPDNGSDYTFLGTIFDGTDYRHGRRSRITPDAPGAKAFAWFWQLLAAGVEPPPALAIYHEGRCGRCGRPLTVPESIRTGIGPVCAGKAA